MTFDSPASQCPPVACDLGRANDWQRVAPPGAFLLPASRRPNPAAVLMLPVTHGTSPVPCASRGEPHSYLPQRAILLGGERGEAREANANLGKSLGINKRTQYWQMRRELPGANHCYTMAHTQ